MYKMCFLNTHFFMGWPQGESLCRDCGLLPFSFIFCSLHKFNLQCFHPRVEDFYLVSTYVWKASRKTMKQLSSNLIAHKVNNCSSGISQSRTHARRFTRENTRLRVCRDPRVVEQFLYQCVRSSVFLAHLRMCEFEVLKF